MSAFNTLKIKKLFAKAVLLSMAGIFLGSCYMPARFDAEIELDAGGYYSLIFDGYIVDVGLFEKLRKGELTEAEETERIAVIERDMLRDVSVQDFRYYKEGHFYLKWERKGDLLKAKTVTFIRRNESILSLKYVEDAGLIEMKGRSMGKDDKDRLAAMGLGTMGEIRFKTSFPVLDHNATEVIDDKEDELAKWYVWRIQNIFQVTPRIVMTVQQ